MIHNFLPTCKTCSVGISLAVVCFVHMVFTVFQNAENILCKGRLILILLDYCLLSGTAKDWICWTFKVTFKENDCRKKWKNGKIQILEATYFFVQTNNIPSNCW